MTHFAFLSDGEEILAFIREDGQIEFWDPQTWTCFKIIHGRDNLTPSGLCWTTNPPRLFSTSLNGELMEWDLQLDQVKSSEQINGGGIWSLATSTSRKDSSSLLAVACEDGIVRLYQLEEIGVSLFGQLQAESPRALSLGWNRNGEALLVGYSDGTCRLWELVLKNRISKMNAGFESVRITLSTNEATGKDVHICAVLCIDEFDEFVCGDSFGGVTIWDKRYGTQLGSFQKHQGAITMLTTYARESVFYLISSGADGGVVLYQRGNDQWEYVHLRRPHVHDVLCLGVFHHGSKHSIVTGSQDSTVRVLSCPLEVDLVKSYLKKKLFTIDLTLERPKFGLSQTQRLLMVTYKKEIEFWKIPVESNEVAVEDRSDGELVSVHDEPQLLTKMKISNEDHIVCGDISSNGDCFAFSNRSHLKIMKLELQEDRLVFHGLLLGKKLSGVCQLVFSRDSKHLFVVDWENNVLVFDLEAKKQCYKMIIPNDPPINVQEAKIAMRCHPKRIEISPDNCTLCIQFHSSIAVYSIPQDFNTQGLKKLAVFKSEIPITSMRAFYDNGLLATMSDGRLRRYGVDDLSCNEWNNRPLQGKQFHSIIHTLQVVDLISISLHSELDSRRGEV